MVIDRWEVLGSFSCFIGATLTAEVIAVPMCATWFSVKPELLEAIRVSKEIESHCVAAAFHPKCGPSDPPLSATRTLCVTFKL